MNKKGMSIVVLFFLFMSFIVGYAVSKQVNFDINKFKGSFAWRNINITTPTYPEIGKAVEYYVNGLGNALFEMVKWIAQFAYENPTIPWKVLIFLLLLSLIAPIVVMLFKILIIIIILTKEIIQSRREKKFLQRYGRDKR